MPPIGRILSVACVLALAACVGDADDRDLVDRVLSSAYEAPEEFAVVPQKPLILPDNLDELPPPQPGTVSRSDLTPRRDAITALTGRDTRAAPIAADGSLLAATGAANRDPTIRQTLAAEDEEFREQNKGLPLDRLFGVVTDRERYSEVLLDPEAELLRLRALGIWVPQLPPGE